MPWSWRTHPFCVAWTDATSRRFEGGFVNVIYQGSTPKSGRFLHWIEPLRFWRCIPGSAGRVWSILPEQRESPSASPRRFRTVTGERRERRGRRRVGERLCSVVRCTATVGSERFCEKHRPRFMEDEEALPPLDRALLVLERNPNLNDLGLCWLAKAKGRPIRLARQIYVRKLRKKYGKERWHE